MTNLFAAASAPSQLIGRQSEIAQIREAICAEGDDLRVVYIVGQGGLGKSRLLAEIRAAAGNNPSATARADLIWPDVVSRVKVADVLDLEPVRLSTTIRFLEDLVNALDPQATSFTSFRAAYLNHRQALVFQSSYDRIQSVLHEALRTFREEYLKITSKQRVVWLLDTGEKFAVPIPSEFDRQAVAIMAESRKQQGRHVDTPIYTHDWLRTVLTTDGNSLKNTTVIMAGRPDGGWWNIFEGLKSAQMRRIDLRALSAEDIPAYFARLTDDLVHIDGFVQDHGCGYAIRRLQKFTEQDAAWVLWAYTGGQPVWLALLADLLIDANEEPPQLEQSPQEVKKALIWNEQTEEFESPEVLRIAQQNLGAMFVQTLFDSSATLRAQILTHLLRSHHPLDAETLEYLIDSAPGEHYSTWRDIKGSNTETVAAITQELEWLQNLAFFKRRQVVYGDAGKPQLQVYLQDVVYEILDDYFASAGIRDREREIDQRTQIYTKLIEVINSRIEQCQRGLRDVWVEERRTLEIELQSQSIYTATAFKPLERRFPDPAFIPLGKRNHLSRTELRNWLEESLLDKLYYLLRIAPKSALNDMYCELADSAWLEHDEDFMTQIEIQMWRLLSSVNARRLVRLEIADAWAKDEDPWVRLQRVAHQDHAVRWLKRMHLRGRYDDVVIMARFIRKYGKQFQASTPESHSWNHTLTIQEARVYEGYAHAYTGQTHKAIRLLTVVVARLKRVLSPGHPKRNEQPFEKDGITVHDGADRVRRVIGLANFILGYAYAAQGNFDLAHAAYNNALPYLRETRFRSLEVYCRFNMARSLAELGYTMEAAKNCQDALNLLTVEGKGGTLPFALASNTLALVFNAERRLTDAWPSAAVAHACFARMNEERGMALAALQFGESLRRMADALHRQPYLPNQETPKHMYQESETVLRSVYSSFTIHPTLRQEELRRVEAAIELASSLRDQVRVLPQPQESELAIEMLREAHNLFRTAERVADQIGHLLLELDARWGLSTLFYRASRTQVDWHPDRQRGNILLSELVESFENIATWAVTSGLIAPGSVISPENTTPGSANSQARALRRVARVYGRLGRIYAEEFRNRSDEVRKSEGLIPYVSVSEPRRKKIHTSVMEDRFAPQYLQRMAECYVLALAYSQMYNPSAALGDYLFGDLYDSIKGFNGVIMQAFTECLKAAEDKYHVHSFQETQSESVQQALERSFGNF